MLPKMNPKRLPTPFVLLAAMMLAATLAVPGRVMAIDNDDLEEHFYGDRGRIDRYLDVEIWTNHNDNEYYEGDNIVLHFRANRDAFVTIYNVDTRGRVSMLFPPGPGVDNFVQGGVTYHLPSNWDDYDLVVTGPDGIENIQVIASRDRFPIPDWYPVSGIVCDWDDRYDFMDYINDRYFIRYDGQRFAYDRTAIYVNEWEPHYFAPVYYPVYHPWTVCGNVYIDYPFGASVYINGIYWGCTPLYLPRVYVGWHTFTVYDHWGYCWESDIHISRYHTVVLDHKVVRTTPGVQSKYKEVRFAGYRDPVSNGYPKYHHKRDVILNSKTVTKEKMTVTNRSGKKVTETVVVSPKKKVRGGTSLVKTKRGWETTGLVKDAKYKGGSSGDRYKRTKVRKGTGDRDQSLTGRYSGKSSRSSDTRGTSRKYGKSRVKVGGKTDARRESSARQSTKKSERSSGYYQRKSGSKSKYHKKVRVGSSKSKSGGGSKKSIVRPKSKSSSGKSGKSNRSIKSRSGGKSGSSRSGFRSSGGRSAPSKSSGGSRGKSGGGKSGGKSSGKGKGRR